jgi:hypothetical protein
MGLHAEKELELAHGSVIPKKTPNYVLISLCLNALNNMVEYEALILGLKVLE